MENCKSKKFNAKDEKGKNYEIEMELTKDSIKFKTEINNGITIKKYSNIFSFDKLKENIVFTIQDDIKEIFDQLEIYIDDYPVSCEINENNIIIKIITKIKKSPEIILELKQEAVDKKDIIEILLEKINLLEAKNNNLESKIGDLELKNNTEIKNNDLNSNNNDLKLLVNNLESKLTNLESNIKTFESKNEDLIFKIKNLESKNKELETKNKELESKNEELESKISNFISKNNTIESDITNIKSKNQEVESINKEIELKISNLQSKINTFESKIFNIDSKNNTNVDSKISELETNFSALESIISNIESKYNTYLDSKLSTIESTINAFKSKLSTIESKDSNNNIESKITNIETKISNIESQNSNNNIESKITNMETKISNIESKLTPGSSDIPLPLKKEIEQMKDNLTTINDFIKEQKELQLERKKYLNFGDSLIVKENEINMICAWIKPNTKLKAKLLYRVSRDGDGADKFHKYCDNKGAIIIFAKINNGYRFGGYSSLSWTSKDKWVKDKDSFLFSLDNKLRFMNNNSNVTIYHGQKYGPYFGGGMFSNELVINFKNNKCISGNNNICNDLGNVFSFKNKELLGIEVKGNYNFDLDDYEVYSISI